MVAKRGVQLRRCSLCGKTGHNRAKCVFVASAVVGSVKSNKVNKIAKTSIKNELLNVNSVKETARNSNLSKVVFVNSFERHAVSPHVVDLTRKKTENIWQKVNHYKTKEPIVAQKYKVVDLAEMIKKHNSVFIKDKNEVKEENEFDLERILKEQKIKLTAKKTVKKSTFNLFVFIKNLTVLVTKDFFKKKELFINFLINIKNNFILLTNRIKNIFFTKKFAYSLVAILLLVSLPFPAIGYYQDLKSTGKQVVIASTNAFSSLQSSMVAALQSNIPQAEVDLNKAVQAFDQATDIIEKDHGALIYAASLLPVVGVKVKSREQLLLAGQHLALGNSYLVKGIGESQKAISFSLTERFDILSNYLKNAIPQYQEALVNLSYVEETSIPVEYQESFKEFKLLFTAFINDLKDLDDLSQTVKTIFGSESLQRYLLVFQNNNEIRPTGGFIGSFAILDVQKGKIINLDVPGGGSYDLQGQLNEYLRPPLPLQLSNKRWEFQDANWFPDFAVSAQKLAWFYEHSRNTSVDGVIAINARVLEKLLLVFGSIEDQVNNFTLSSTNTLEQLQYQVEVNYNKEKNKPKEVIANLASQFLQEFNNVDKMQVVRLLTVLNDSLQNKDIQVYFNDVDVQKKMQNYGWTGEIIPTKNDQDYLLVVNANLQGQKSDAKIEQTIEHQAEIQADGSIVDTVIVKRKHTGEFGENFYGVNNVDYLRVYVPLGSELLEAGGFNYPPESAFKVPENSYVNDQDLINNEKEVALEAKTGTRITEEFGKTGFGNWVITSPGQESEIYFKYKLPFTVQNTKNVQSSLVQKIQNILQINNAPTSHFTLLIQKQSGIDSKFSSYIIYPDNWQPFWKLNEKLELAQNGSVFEEILDRDLLLGLIMQKVK